MASKNALNNITTEESNIAINASNGNLIQFDHTNVKEQYNNIDAEDTVLKPTTVGVDFGPHDFRSIVHTDNNNVVDEYDRVGSFLPREEFNKFLQLIENESLKMAGWGPKENIFQNFVSRLDRFGTALVPMNMLNTGYTFITRPRLNLTVNNLRTNGIMSTLATGNPNSVAFMIRGLLDTVLAGGKDAGYSSPNKSGPLASLATGAHYGGDIAGLRNTILAEAENFHKKAMNSPLIDVNNPFLVPLCNGLKGISGFPDFTVETETTEGDFHSGDFTFVKGSDMNNRTNELSLEFRDVNGSIIMSIIFYWVLAMALQAKGVMIPYPDDIYEQRLNYTVSIYRFVMDTSKKHILWWAKATGCYPKSAPIGSLFNISQGEVILTSAQNFSIPFVANTIEVNDPNILLDFNTLVSRYNPTLCSSEGAYSESRKDGGFTLDYTHPMYNFIGLPVVVSTNSGLQLVWRTSAKYLELQEQKAITEKDANGREYNTNQLQKAYKEMIELKNKKVAELESKIKSGSSEGSVLDNARQARVAQAMKAKLDTIDPKIKTGSQIERSSKGERTSYSNYKNVTTGARIERT